MSTIFVIIVAVIICAIAFFIHVGKSIQSGNYTPFKNRINTSLRNDNKGEIAIDLHIMEVLMKLDFETGTKDGLADGEISHSTVQILGSDLALLYVGTIYFEYLDKYILDNGFDKNLHFKIDVFRNVFYKIFTEAYNTKIEDSPIPEVIRNVSCVKLENDDISKRMIRIFAAYLFKSEAQSTSFIMLSSGIVEKCILEWEGNYLPDAYYAIVNWQAEDTSFRDRLENILSKETSDKATYGLQLLKILLKFGFKTYAEKKGLYGKIRTDIIKRLESDVTLVFCSFSYYNVLYEYVRKNGYNKELNAPIEESKKVFAKTFMEIYHNNASSSDPIPTLKAPLYKELLGCFAEAHSNDTDESKCLLKVLTTFLFEPDDSSAFDVTEGWIRDLFASYLSEAYDFIDKLQEKHE